MSLIPAIRKSFSKLRTRKVDLHGYGYTVEELVGMYESSRDAIKWHGEILSDKILKHKKSDTLFILGSGPSINQISSAEWLQIGKHDSIGFNFWFIHDFVPTFYMYQHSAHLQEVFKKEFPKYSNVPVIWRGSNLAKGLCDFSNGSYDFLKTSEVYFLNEYPVSSKSAIDIDLLYRFFDSLGFMTSGKIPRFVPKLRSTVGLLAMLGYNMGYEKIVLCGVDMDGDDHSWDYGHYTSKKKEHRLPDSEPVWTFLSTEISPNTVPDYIYKLNDWVKKRKSEIFIYSDKTVLKPRLRKFEF